MPNEVVSINVNTGIMTGYKNFPAGMTGIGANAFYAIIYDGKTVWLIPAWANMAVGIDPTTGTMTGYANFPGGKSGAFYGAVYDGSNIWMIPYTANMVVKLTGGNPSPAANLVDGLGQSIPYDASSFTPLGSNITMTGYNNWPTGITASSPGFASGVYDKGTGDIWMAPNPANQVVKYSTATGTMTGYSNWPTNGYTAGTFYGMAYTNTDVWMIPQGANQVVKVNKSTGAMTGYGNWPTDVTLGTARFVGGVLAGTDLWMAPYNANKIVKVDTLTGGMTSYGAFPSGFVPGTSMFAGAVYDGNYIWFIPFQANMIIKLDPITGNMTGYNAWPTGYTKTNSTFIGGTFDGTNIWLCPSGGQLMAIKINVSTGVMTGYNGWPSGYNNLGFTGAIYDGKTVWLAPRSGNMVVAVDAATGTMKGYANFPEGQTMTASSFIGEVFDGTHVWLIPNTSNMLVKLSTGTGTITSNADVKEAYGAVWKRVFYHNAQNNTVWWASDAETLSSNTANKYSILGQLDNYKNSNGEFEFLLEYPNNVTLAGQYNRWKQTSNPTTSAADTVTGYSPVAISWTDNGWGGLGKSSSTTNTFIDGTIYPNPGNWYYSIGQKVNWTFGGVTNGIAGPISNQGVQEVELWVRIDNLPNYKVAYGAVWEKAFYHNAQNGTVWWAAGDTEILSANTANKYSILGQLDNFKRSNGEFEFLMETPSIAGFNRWKQTSNPVTSAAGTISGYVPTNVSWTAGGWGGLGKSTDNAQTFIDGSPTATTGSYWYAIGQKGPWPGGSGIPVSTIGVQELYLWVRMDNLIVP